MQGECYCKSQGISTHPNKSADDVGGGGGHNFYKMSIIFVNVEYLRSPKVLGWIK